MSKKLGVLHRAWGGKKRHFRQLSLLGGVVCYPRGGDRPSWRGWSGKDGLCQVLENKIAPIDRQMWGRFCFSDSLSFPAGHQATGGAALADINKISDRASATLARFCFRRAARQF